MIRIRTIDVSSIQWINLEMKMFSNYVHTSEHLYQLKRIVIKLFYYLISDKRFNKTNIGSVTSRRGKLKSLNWFNYLLLGMYRIFPFCIFNLRIFCCHLALIISINDPRLWAMMIIWSYDDHLPKGNQDT